MAGKQLGREKKIPCGIWSDSLLQILCLDKTGEDWEP
jgi:hypothetical protein